MNEISLVAKTSSGLEDLLVNEVIANGGREARKGIRSVTFKGTEETLYRMNLNSRVALRILKPIGSFPANNEEQLYDGIGRINWGKYMSADDTLAVDAVTVKSNLTHSLYVALKTKDAVVDQFRKSHGRRPDVDLNRPTIRINVHLSGNVASISLDSSGESLHKRGYRMLQGEAPLSETLAAGLILLSAWKQDSPLTDIMCGSGTIVIEAALMARDIAPGLMRNEFGFQRWLDYDAGLWANLVKEARGRIKDKLGFRIAGVDRNRHVIRQARENSEYAGVDEDIDFHEMKFQDYTPAVSEQTLITNPPYGGRITDEDLFDLYKQMGDTFKKRYQGSTAWVLTANRDAAKHIGLHVSAKIPVFNGPLECRLLKFEMYGGSRKPAKGSTIQNNEP